MFKPGPLHHNWSGGFHLTTNGYTCILVDTKKTMLLHILLMEWKIGRKLRKDECVHHINEIRNDNRLSNLKLMTKSEHGRHHATGQFPSAKTRELLCNIRKGTNQKEVHPQWKGGITKESIIMRLNWNYSV